MQFSGPSNDVDRNICNLQNSSISSVSTAKLVAITNETSFSKPSLRLFVSSTMKRIRSKFKRLTSLEFEFQFLDGLDNANIAFEAWGLMSNDNLSSDCLETGNKDSCAHISVSQQTYAGINSAILESRVRYFIPSNLGAIEVCESVKKCKDLRSLYSFEPYLISPEASCSSVSWLQK